MVDVVIKIIGGVLIFFVSLIIFLFLFVAITDTADIAIATSNLEDLVFQIEDSKFGKKEASLALTSVISEVFIAKPGSPEFLTCDQQIKGLGKSPPETKAYFWVIYNNDLSSSCISSKRPIVNDINFYKNNQIFGINIGGETKTNAIAGCKQYKFNVETPEGGTETKIHITEEKDICGFGDSVKGACKGIGLCK